MERNSHRTLVSFVAGLAAGAVAVAVSLILKETSGGLFLPEITSQTLFSLTPGEFESQAVETFGPLAKYSAFIGSINANIVAFGIIGIFLDKLYARLKRRGYLLEALLSSALSYIIFIIIAIILVTLIQSRSGIQVVPIPLIVLSLIPSQLGFGFVLSSFFHGRAKRKSLEVLERSPDKSIDTKEVEYSRRAFLRLVAASAVALPIIFLGVDRLLSRQNGAQGLASTSPPTGNRFLYPIVGTSWDSDTTWKNGKPRTLTRQTTSGGGVPDPYDSKMKLGGGPRPVMIIHGDGTATLTGQEVDAFISSSNRVFVQQPWTNTETTLDLLIGADDITCTDLQIRSRSKHVGPKCDFGNYLDKWAFLQHFVSHEIELIHPIYKRKIGLKTIEPLPRNKWLSFKSVCRTITGQNKVLLESYISHDPSKNEWIKMVSTTFGTNESFTPEHDYDQALVDSCIGQGDKTVDNLNNHFFAGPATSIMIRLDKCKNIKIKSFSIREIDPIGTTPTPGFEDPNLAPLLASEVTPTYLFYRIDINPIVLQVDSKSWKLAIKWLVEKPLTINYDQIKSMPSVEEYVTLECINNKIGGDLSFAKLLALGNPRVIFFHETGTSDISQNNLSAFTKL